MQIYCTQRYKNWKWQRDEFLRFSIRSCSYSILCIQIKYWKQNIICFNSQIVYCELISMQFGFKIVGWHSEKKTAIWYSWIQFCDELLAWVTYTNRIKRNKIEYKPTLLYAHIPHRMRLFIRNISNKAFTFNVWNNQNETKIENSRHNMS